VEVLLGGVYYGAIVKKVKFHAFCSPFFARRSPLGLASPLYSTNSLTSAPFAMATTGQPGYHSELSSIQQQRQGVAGSVNEDV
jgi:hypothetical protein